MKRAIKTHYKDVLAVSGLALIALAVLLGIIANQKAALPSWVPGLGKSFYSLNVEFETAQAVTPGQGQAATIAGIDVGKVGAASLDNGIAKVRIDIEPKYKDLIHQNAHFMLRPKTGLNDMVVEIDPGTKGPPPAAGSTMPASQSLSNVQLDSFWASLDKDTQDYLVLLLNGAGQGLAHNGPELSQTLRRFGPFAAYTAKLNGALEKRQENIKSGIHAFSQIATELGNNDQAVADFVTNSKNSLGDFAAEQDSLQRALQEFPSTLRAAQSGLSKSTKLSRVLKPTLLGLIPGSKNLKASLISVQHLAENTTPTIRNNIRPFTIQTQPVFRDLATTSKALAKDSPQLKGVLLQFNNLFDLLAHNPSGSADEGYLFWAAWANHNLNSALNSQDAEGPVRRSISLVNCNTAQQAHNVSLTYPILKTAYQLAQLPPQEAICPATTITGP